MKVFEYEDFEPRSRCSIAAAVLGAGALTAGANIYGSIKAGDAQKDAQTNSLNLIKQLFGTIQGQAQPFIDAGKSALPSLQGLTDTSNPNSPLSALLRLVTPGASQTETLSQTPGFQFSNEIGQKAVGNALAARGLAGPGGSLARGSADYAEGLAGTQYTSIVQALLSAFTGGAGALTNQAGVGTNALNTLSSAAGGAATNSANAITGLGNAAAGQASGIASAVGGFGNSASTAAILQKLLGNSGGTSGSSGLYTGDPTLPGWDSNGNLLTG